MKVNQKNIDELVIKAIKLLNDQENNEDDCFFGWVGLEDGVYKVGKINGNNFIEKVCPEPEELEDLF